MRKAIFLLMVGVCLNLVYSPACQTKAVILSSGADVELDYRTLEPGEVIAVEIKNPADMLEAKVKFLNRSYRMGMSETSQRLLAFISLDLELEPGFYPLTVFMRRLNGQWEKAQRRITVPGKEFPVNKLWVDKKFITPPKKFWERIEWESELLRVLFSGYTSRWLGEGGFVFPSAGSARPSFGERRLFNNFHWSTHRGVDVASPFGSPVIASNSGMIVLARNLYYAGNAVIIDHGVGVFTFYCHLSRFGVKRGDFVRKGDIIGRVGATGRVTGPHLHWAVRVAGKNVDPYSLLNLNLDL
jgi:murein DD-endopeptidase MepM/ murein hydrolase activator NlpD